ncbi:MAG: putative F420-0 ABC transporter substrate-binding protein [Microbacteriaceae bacterium]|nr:putative F420-0 ABC transporter substrate-binding protein [Microbacteriaceae bacterium]
MPVHPVPAIALVAASVALLAGCTAGTAPAPASPTASTGLTIDNCGFEVSFDAAPERVVTIKSTSTEMLLALGLGDRIVGTAFQDGPVPEEWAAEAAGLVSVADKVPGEEAVLDLEPDLVYAGWESNFSVDGAGERSELASLGVASYVSPAACQSSGQPAKLTFDEIFREIDEVGRIFGAEDAAESLVESQRAELVALQPVTGSPTAFWFSSGSDTPYSGGDIGAPQLVMETAGLTNIVTGVNATWTPLSWEAVIDADPDVIVLVDAAWNSVDKKIAYLEGNPATAQLTAVREHRYAVIPFPAGEAGVRSVSAAVSLAQQVRELHLP